MSCVGLWDMFSLFSFKWVGRVCFLNVTDTVLKNLYYKTLSDHTNVFAYNLHYVSVFYSYLYNYSIGNGSQQ